MLWTVQHFWPVGARFAFNFYKHRAQLLFRQPGELPVTILIREEVTQGDPLSMVLYGITLVPLAEELQAADPGSSPLSTQMMHILTVRRDAAHSY